MKMVEVEVLERVVRDKADRGKHFAYIGGLHAVVSFIKNGEIPTVDAVPVVHGRWVKAQEPLGWSDVDCIECSSCHATWIIDDEYGFEDSAESWKY